LFFDSPTASNVASIGEKNPYAAPPMKLAAIPTTGHKIKGTGRAPKQRTNFKTGPSCLALLIQGKEWQINYGGKGWNLGHN